MTAPPQTIGFFCAHRQAVENLTPVADAVKALGHDVLFLDGDPLFDQHTASMIATAGFRTIPVVDRALPQPLPRYSSLARARLMMGLRGAIRERAALAKVWMICGDNAPHRALMELAPPGTFRVSMADAVFSEADLTWSHVARHGSPADYFRHYWNPIRTKILHGAIAAGTSSLLPGRSGHSAADLMVLAGQYNLEVVRASRGNVPFYWPVGLPRFANSLRVPMPAPASASLGDRPLRVAVFPSAFAWHGHTEEQKIQDAIVRDLAQALNPLRDVVELVIKKHPREAEDFYRQLASEFAKVRVDIGSPAAPILEWSDVVVTLMSSVALEAIMVGKPAVLTGWRYPWWRLHGSPYAHPAFPRPENIERMVTQLLALRDGNELSRVAGEQRKLRDYIFAPTSAEAPGRIAAVLSAALDNPERARQMACEWGAVSL